MNSISSLFAAQVIPRFLLKVMVLAGGILLGHSLHAQSTTRWTGNEDGFFENDNNWTNGRPTITTVTYFGSITSGIDYPNITEMEYVNGLIFNADAPSYNFNIRTGNDDTGRLVIVGDVVNNSANRQYFYIHDNDDIASLGFSYGNAGTNTEYVITGDGGTKVDFIYSSAGSATFKIEGATSYVEFLYSYGANAIIENTGSASSVRFVDSFSENATIRNAGGGVTFFQGTSEGSSGTTIHNDVGGALDISRLSVAEVTLGNVYGPGIIYLGSKTLLVGSSNANAEISGSINDFFIGTPMPIGPLTFGSLTKQGTGRLLLSGASTYTGTTHIDGGTLATNNVSALGLYDGTTIGSNAVLLRNGSTLELVSNLTIQDFQWHANGRVQLNPATTALTVNDQFEFLGLAANSGRFVIDGSGLGIQSYTLVNFGSTNYANTDPFTASFVNVSGNVFYDYEFVLNANNLQLNILGIQATGPILQNSAPINIPVAADFYVIGSVVTGTSVESNIINSLNFEADSELTVFNNLQVTSGTLETEGGTRLTSALSNDATLSTTAANYSVNTTTTGGIFEISVALTGNAGLIKSGTGIVVMFGDNTYTGATDVTQGRLAVMADSSAATGTITVRNGAAIGGSGIIGGDVVVENGGSLWQGHTVSPSFDRSLEIRGNLTLNNLSEVMFMAGPIGTVGGFNTLYDVTGNLVLDGQLSRSFDPAFGGYQEGAYRIFNYGGTLTNNGLEQVIPNPYHVISTAVNGQVNLIVTGPDNIVQFWDGPNTTAGVEGGAGSWTNFNHNFTDAAGAVNEPWQNGTALFAVTGGVVTVDDEIHVQGIQFMANGYEINQGTGGPGIGLVLDTPDESAASIIADTGVTATIAANIRGDVVLHKQGEGIVKLRGTNTYDAGTLITNGYIDFETNENLGTGNITLNGGGLMWTDGDVDISGRLNPIGDDGAFFHVQNAGSVTFATGLTGTGGVTKEGGTFLIFTAANTYTGLTTVNNGVIALELNGALIPDAEVLVNAGGAFHLRDATSMQNGNVVVSGAVGDAAYLVFTDDATAANATVTNTFGQTRFFAQSTAANAQIENLEQGFVAFLDDSNAASATIINRAGGGTGFFHQSTGTTATTITNEAGAVLDISRLTVDGVVIGEVSGGGDIYLGSRALTLGGKGTDVTISGVIQDGFVTMPAVPLPTLATVGGSLVKEGSGTYLLTGANTYTGGTTINAGRLSTANISALGSGPVLLNAGSLQPQSTLAVSDFTWQGGKLELPLIAGGTRLAVANDFLNGSGGSKTFVLDFVGQQLVQSYTLVTYGGDTNFNVADFIASGLTDIPNVKFTHEFVLTDSAVLFNITSATAWGGILQNSAPVFIPTFADFLVFDAVRTGTFTESNTIKSLIFAPDSSLLVFNTLNVTSGNLTVPLGSATLTGGTVITPADFNKLGAGKLNVNSNVYVSRNLNVRSGTLAVNSNFAVQGNAFVAGGSRLQINPGGYLSAASTGIAGVAAVNGVLHSPYVNVHHGGTLQGVGLIIGNVFNSGTVAPGNSIGTLTIHGNYTQRNNGTLQIEVASVNHHDILVVSGTSRLSGTLEVASLGYRAAYGDQIPFLIGGNITGRFDEITMPNPDRLRGRFVNEGNVGVLLVAPASYTLVARNENQRNVARALDEWIGIEEGDIGVVTLALDYLRENQYGQAFDAIMPTYYEAALSTGIELSQSHQQQIHQYLNARRLADRVANVPVMPAAPSGKQAMEVRKAVVPVMPAEADYRWSAWTQASGLFSSGGLSLNPGEDFESGTYIVGADYLINERVAIGLFASYQEGWGDYAHAGDIDVESTRFGGYLTYDDGEGFYANAVIGGGQTGFDVQRPIQWATLSRTADSEPDGWEFFTGISLGKDIKRGNWTFGPQLTVQYSKLELGEFNETGANVLNLRVHDANSESLRSYLGGRIAYTHKVNDKLTIIPEVRAFWQHEFLGGDSFSSSLDSGFGGRFSYRTAGADRDSVLLGAGLGFLIGERVYMNVYYNADLGRNGDENHTISINATVKF